MKKILAMGALAALLAIYAIPVMAEQPATPTEPIKMALTKKPVTFNHTTHAKVECVQCHHLVDGKENFQKCSDAGCHDKLGNKDKSVNSYYRIAHDAKTKNTCISCHNEVAGKDKDKKKELTSCVGSACHPKA